MYTTNILVKHIYHIHNDRFSDDLFSYNIIYNTNTALIFNFWQVIHNLYLQNFSWETWAFSKSFYKFVSSIKINPVKAFWDTATDSISYLVVKGILFKEIHRGRQLPRNCVKIGDTSLPSPWMCPQRSVNLCPNANHSFSMSIYKRRECIDSL